MKQYVEITPSELGWWQMQPNFKDNYKLYTTKYGKELHLVEEEYYDEITDYYEAMACDLNDIM